MRKFLCAILAVGLLAGPAAAQVTDFDSFGLTSVNYQGAGGTTVTPGGYTVPDPYGSLWTVADEWGNPPLVALDEGVVDDGTGNKVWRISNAVTQTGYSNLPFSLSSPLAAGESTAALWNDRGDDHTAPLTPPLPRATAATPYFHASLRFKSATGTPQAGLALSLSPGPRQGNIRSAFVSISDNGATGLDVGFYDTDAIGGFISTTLATDLSYSDWHELDIYITFADGLNGDASGNDVVSIQLDGNTVHQGTTWETYYALYPGSFPQNPYAADALMFRVAGTAQPGLSGGGLFIDDVLIDNEPYPAVHNLDQDTYYSSIQAAIDAANPGETIDIEAGTYNENLIVNKSLTLLGANADAVCGARGAESVISPASGLPVSITADDVVFNGFEVTTAAHQYGIILSGTSNVEVVHNNVHDINSSATPVIANTYGIYYSVPNGDANSNVTIADNCIDSIASSNVTGSSCAAIGILQSTSTGTLSDLVIARNTITDVNVNTGSWPTGKIAYGMILNTGSSGYLTTTGKIIDVVIEDNVIDGLSGFISTAIGLEGNTENALVTGNVITNLYGAKTADRSGGGYDLNGIKFETNRYVGTATVEYNSIDRSTFDHNGTMDRGYAVANYVPVGDAYTGGTTSAAIVTCNWFGTADAGAIADVADLSGAILNKDGAETGFIPFLINSDINTPDCSGGSSVAALPAVNGPINCNDTVVLSISYTPDGLTPGLRGYSVTLGATAGVLSFGMGDIEISNALDPLDNGADLPYVLDNGDGTFTVDNGILGNTTGLTSAATLFTVEIHPDATGSGTVDLLDVTLRDVDNVNIPTAASGAAITVDCIAPPAASIAAQPGPNSVRLTWTIDNSDVDHFELYRAVWHTGDNTTSAYPEYDD
ncbi:MAG TPA: right-handed parallel beta-helix repeat-containing protein, partial [Candidatus Krumholzibacteria bacterium]|nr:right-handed parallel beta-helix repeat-containing protein [Candidatus Krumholzibacteria bacterium]HRX51770.1 right-handed parallel beta-helix repeat-containing protein [Candidatus Krumholzibacteria bacterium]